MHTDEPTASASPPAPARLAAHAARAHLDEVLDEVRALARPEEAQAATTFAAALYRHEHLLPDGAAARALEGFRFLAGRRADELAVRVVQPGAHGPRRSVLEVAVGDQPFVVTSLQEVLAAAGESAVLGYHAVVGVERDDAGALRSLGAARGSEHREAFSHLELDAALDDERADALLDTVREALTSLRLVTRDHRAMRAALRAAADGLDGLADEDDVGETQALVEWFLDGHAVLLGSIDLEPATEEAEGLRPVRPGLGVLTEVQDEPWRPAVREGALVAVERTSRLAPVHRRNRMTRLALRRPDGGEHHLVCTLADKAYTEPSETIPLLRRRLQSILAALDVVAGSHDERQLRALFQAIPPHELFPLQPAALRGTLGTLLTARRRGEVRLVLRPDRRGRTLSALVALPRERFTPAVRRRIQGLLAADVGAEAVDYHLSLDQDDQALLHFGLHLDEALPDGLPVARVEALEAAIAEVSRTLVDRLVDRLAPERGPAEAVQAAARFAALLDPGYAETVDLEAALADLVALEQDRDAALQVRLRRVSDDPPGAYRVRLLRQGPALELSDLLPVLESFGLTITEETTHALGREGARAHVHEVGVRADRGHLGPADLDPERDSARLADAITAALDGRMEVDSLNRLLLAAGLQRDEVGVLRCYRHYRRQLGTTASTRFLNDTLVAHPRVARALVALFDARLDPGIDTGERVTVEEAALAAVEEALTGVQRFDADRALRAFLDLVLATVRTNRWSPTKGDALALKIDGAMVTDMPAPRPWREVFLSGPTVRGVHLRGGPVARGGLRWSDRLEDVRTEVLGLLKAQIAKNALIVPTGAKGGFALVRAEPRDSDDVARAVEDAYRTYVRALLDVTDDLVDGAAVGPAGVVRRDGDDPYLVVAADRGTARLSDVANELAEERGFWLGDAFASGGSRGYDHKAMGITARGAWVTAKEHFRELDVDLAQDEITVVGIGDMSGDVFGNGMLQSRALRLVAAFDHRHVFLDPDPDPERSYRERARLAELPRSSWDDYDRGVVSDGGGVWDRTVRAIPLAPPVRALLRVEAAELSPPELIQAILRAPVDLLFAGGIGTFVKASDESDADAGDRANDAIRVDAGTLGARVVSEGGNLALTQPARLQYARRGGICNTDAVDNAAGVATSDREVNLKILLDPAVRAGRLEARARDALLAGLTEEIAEDVLGTVGRQARALTREAAVSARRLADEAALLRRLEDAGRLIREVEHLPDEAELTRRAEAGAGLSRPALAVLLAYAKIDLADALVGTAVPDAPWLQPDLRDAFPARAVEAVGEGSLVAHPLRRELLATRLANEVVDRMGATWAERVAGEDGVAPWCAASAFGVAVRITAAHELWTDVEAIADRTTPELRRQLEARVDDLIDQVSRIYVSQGAAEVDQERFRRDRSAFAVLRDLAPRRGPARLRRETEAQVGEWVDLGLDEGLAQRLAGLRGLSVTPLVGALVQETGAGTEEVAELLWRLADELPFDELRERVEAVETTGRWGAQLRKQLAEELTTVQLRTARRLLRDGSDVEGAAAAVRAVTAAAPRAVEALQTVLEELRGDDDPGLEAMAVVVHALRVVLEGGLARG